MLAILVLSLALAGCGSADAGTTPTATGGAGGSTATATPTMPSTPTAETATATVSTSTPESTPGSGDTTTLLVYFLRDEKVAAARRTVPKTTAVGAAAVRELLAGPNQAEQAAGMSTAIPSGTEFLDLNIADKVATVNLSKQYESGGGSLSMAARLAQVVYTLTQFPSIETVQFQLDGQPVTTFGGEGLVLDHPVGRSNYEDLTPAILIESPTPGDSVTSPVRVSGTANTFEATFFIDIVDGSGAVLTEQMVTATSGTGTRGTFDVTIPYTIKEAGPGKIVAFEKSAKDGSPTHQVEIPVELGK